MKILECVKVSGKLKVQVVGDGGNVQFPKDLRVEGKKFAANVVKSGSFWKVSGEIFELVNVKEEKTSSYEEKDYYAIIERNGWEGETWTFFIKKSDPNIQEVAQFLKENPDFEAGEASFDIDEVSKAHVMSSLKSKSNKSGYFHTYNYVDSASDNVKDFLSLDEDEKGNVLYKGGFADGFKSVKDLDKESLKKKVKKI